MKKSKLTSKKQFPVYALPDPITDELLEKYAAMIDAQPVGPIKDAMTECFQCVAHWWNLDESKEKAKSKHKVNSGKTYEIVPLQKDHIAALDSKTPWRHECEAMNKLFDTMPNGLSGEVPAQPGVPASNIVGDQEAFDLYNAAKHLLWYTWEITSDREPLTKDKLIAPEKE